MPPLNPLWNFLAVTRVLYDFVASADDLRVQTQLRWRWWSLLNPVAQIAETHQLEEFCLALFQIGLEYLFPKNNCWHQGPQWCNNVFRLRMLRYILITVPYFPMTRQRSKMNMAMSEWQSDYFIHPVIYWHRLFDI